MPRIVDAEMVEPVTRALLGSIDIGDGGTDEQRAVLSAIVGGYWARPDLDLAALEPLTPEEAASAVTDHAHRRRLREMMVLLEACRHPLTETQVAHVETYAHELGESGPGMAMIRALLAGGAQHAMADYQRFFDAIQPEIVEPSLAAEYSERLTEPDPEIATRLRALHDLPEGTLGYEYIEFYRRNNLAVPGEDDNAPAFFVAHDMCHVIGGYGPTGPEEIALGAMKLGVADTDPHWVEFLGNLAVHEAGFFTNEAFVGKTATLTREGAAELLSEGFLRGSRCTGDFTTIDHLTLAAEPIEDVRAQFGVPSRS